MKNTYSYLQEMALIYPDKVALFNPIKIKDQFDYTSLSYFELIELIEKLAFHFFDLGIRNGDKTLVFLKPSLHFAPVTFALFKIGAIPVFIDPGMGLKKMKASIKNISPTAMIGVSKIHLLKPFFKNALSSVKVFISDKKIPFNSTPSLSILEKKESQLIENFTPNENDPAAILFTSGATGIPKGVVYTHETFNTQIGQLQKMFNLTSSDVDVPGFPLFSFFTLCMGMTSAIPYMDPSKPIKANPKYLVQNIMDHDATFLAGSPAIWEKVADYCLLNNIVLETVKVVAMFGAPVSPTIHEKFQKVLPNGNTFTPYGATESLPISNISGKEILGKHIINIKNGMGMCVGIPVNGVNVKIIKINNGPLTNIEMIHELPINEIGEIIVSGKNVTKTYFNNKQETTKSKIYDPQKQIIWHRIGDLGYFDKFGNLWFCGRVAHRIDLFKRPKYSVNCEAIFNHHPEVKRSALIGLGPKGAETPAIVIETKNGKIPKGQDRMRFEYELHRLATEHSHTKDIVKIFFKKSFPVDIRHNIKIDREALKKEFERQERT